MSLIPTRLRLVVVCCLVLLSGHVRAQQVQPVPPVAPVRPTQLEKHGHVRVDHYYWLNRRDDRDVLEYLRAEKAYYESATSHLRAVEDRLYDEIKGRIQETDLTVPVKRYDYVYFTRFEQGKQYPILCRRRDEPGTSDTIMLDVNAVAEGHAFCSLGDVRVSSGQNLLAYAVDTVGRRFHTIRFRDLESGHPLADQIPNVTGQLAWANDNRTLFYTKQHPETLRSYQVLRHVLGTDPADDQLVYEEPDETFDVSVSKTRSERYILIRSQQTLSTEYRYLDADRPDGSFAVFAPRRRNHEYDVEHLGEYFYIRTNREAQNFRLMRAPLADTGEEAWQPVIAHRPNVLLEDFLVFQDHLVLQERAGGLPRVRVRRWSDDSEHEVQFDEPAYGVFLSSNPNIDTHVLRYAYTSLTTPMSVYDYDMVACEKTLLKRTAVLGDFDPDQYQSERLFARARDGTSIPVSLVYRKQLLRSGQNPLLLVGYGSYGISLNPYFSVANLSLLDRGFVYAIAHVRGGQELGRAWYEDGKLLKKKNTFTDFIDVAEHLVHHGYAHPQKLYASGGSAGGLLIGAVINLRPDLFHGAIAHVPFVDVLSTMLDENIPLTTAEYDEWGNPNVKEFYDYILSYSPYDNVTAQRYPNLLVTASLYDSQVQYWEPAKWVAKLRATKTDNHRVLLRIEMEAGHDGPSGRYRQIRETARDWAFLLDLAGIAP